MNTDFSLLPVAVKNLKRKPLRTVMLAASIMLLAAVLVFALSFIYRVHSGVRIMTERLGADVIVVPTGSRGPAEEVLLENRVKSFYMSAFLAWTVFSAVANERSKDVGIMRTLGAREDHVMKLFLAEVVLIGASGSIAGIVAGTLLSLSLSGAFTILKNIATDLHAADRAVIAVIGFIVGTGVCSIGAMAPIRRMKRLEPLVVIKEG